jgi:hypothetical protein
MGDQRRVVSGRTINRGVTRSCCQSESVFVVAVRRVRLKTGKNKLGYNNSGIRSQFHPKTEYCDNLGTSLKSITLK